MQDMNSPVNHLIFEKSPYLLQHAHNPVNWYPWGDEAFAAAKREDKPVFLSIGYSTCHWCHVMERESFEDEEVAALLNEGFVSIKVDREERPDVDHIYMSVCQALTGSGGWPLSIFLTPDREPFFAGTYFPKHPRGGIRGFVELLDLISQKWSENRDELVASARRIAQAVAGSQKRRGKDETPEITAVRRAVAQLSQAFDDAYGGFGYAPKFPTPHTLLFLMRVWAAEGDVAALAMADKTLDAMRRGGIYDHIGGGFCRYSTDERWLAPHFEKMLYDNALLMLAYTEGYQATGKEAYARTVREIADYVLRAMTSEDGGFYSAEDADSEGEEGKFYLWTVQEVVDALGEEDGNRFCGLYGIAKRGNFEGKSIPNLIREDIPPEEAGFAVRCRETLFAVRERRVHPHKDDKILASWNGLMVAALAKAGVALGEQVYVQAARRAANFVLERLVREDGRLLARYRDGEAKYPAYAEDYAFFVWGLLELYGATFDVNRLIQALALTDALVDLFWDEKEGGLFAYGSDAEQLIFRPKNVYDGATPSANSVFAYNCLVLAGLTGRTDLSDKAQEVFTAFAASMSSQPTGHTHLICVFLYGSSPSADLTVCADSLDAAQEMIDGAQDQYRPFLRLRVKTPKIRLEQVAPDAQGYVMQGNRPTAYVCVDHACRPPVTDVNELRELLAMG